MAKSDACLLWGSLVFPLVTVIHSCVTGVTTRQLTMPFLLATVLTAPSTSKQIAQRFSQDPLCSMR